VLGCLDGNAGRDMAAHPKERRWTTCSLVIFVVFVLDLNLLVDVCLGSLPRSIRQVTIRDPYSCMIQLFCMYCTLNEPYD
jgi:hypothetical protein